MGIFDFLKGFTSPKAMCEQIIHTNEVMYKKVKKQYPNRKQHEYLAMVWLSRMGAQPKAHFRDLNNDAMSLRASSETQLFACVPPEKCARALGLYILYKERPQWLERYTEFQNEFNRLMAPVLKAQEDGTMDLLYNKYNPNCADNEEDKKKEPTNALDAFISSAYGNPPPAKRADVTKAAQLAHKELLVEVIPLDRVSLLAQELNESPIPYSTHDLAVSVALHFFKQPEFIRELSDAQLFARMKALEWFEQGKVVQPLMKSFEEVLYRLYKPIADNNKDIKKKPANALEEYIFTVYGNPPPAKRADVTKAAQLAYSELLMKVVSEEQVVDMTSHLNESPIPYSTHDLAVSVALHFFKQPEVASQFDDIKVAVAMIHFLRWSKQGKVVPPLLKNWGEVLNRLYPSPSVSDS